MDLTSRFWNAKISDIKLKAKRLLIIIYFFITLCLNNGKFLLLKYHFQQGGLVLRENR